MDILYSVDTRIGDNRSFGLVTADLVVLSVFNISKPVKYSYRNHNRI